MKRVKERETATILNFGEVNLIKEVMVIFETDNSSSSVLLLLEREILDIESCDF